MQSRTKLFLHKNIYDHGGTQGLFLAAMEENHRHHVRNCPEYARIADGSGFDGRVSSIDDLAKIPCIPSLYFKKHALFSVPEKSMRIKAKSSGTGGSQSSIALDLSTLSLGIHMVLRVFSYNRLLSLKPVHYMVLGYKPDKQNEMGAVKTAYGTTFLAPALSRSYALERRDGQYQINEQGMLAALLRHEKSPFPVRFVGFPSFLYHLLIRLEEKGIQLKLAKGSRVLLGGGWKQFGGEEVSKKELYDLVGQRLGIGRGNIHEFFSAVEHPIAYCACKEGNFHIPVYSRVIIRDIQSFEPLPNGRPGLLSFITPLVTSVPLLSVATDDLATLLEGRHCGCGNTAPFFMLHGRAGVKDIQTCAADAAKYLGQSGGGGHEAN